MTRALIFTAVLLVAAGGCGTDAPPPTGEPDAGGCPEGQEACGDACVDLDEDPAHCGRCDNACGGDQPFCVHGECEDDCRPLARCEGVCVSLRSDPEHCGSCDRVCEAEAPVCGEGECFARCPDGAEPCGEGECPDTATDPRHCGGCDNACGAEQRCQDGQCVSDEPCVAKGLTLCEGRCVDLATDDENCGRCDGECADGDQCLEGACTCPGGECVECGDGETDCNDAPDLRDCRDLSRDEQSCGQCGNECDGGEECVGGECLAECGGEGDPVLCDGECVDLETDPAHCGGCETACEPDEQCVRGDCAVVEPTECLACPCEDCDDDQRCCENDGQVVCVTADDCPED